MTTYSILLVEDNAADADYIQRALRRSEGSIRFEVSVVGWLNTALTAVGARSYDAVLLDLSLPDSQGLDTVVQFLSSAPQLPVIVMTGFDDMQTGVNAVRYGAQDYLIKGDTGDRSLERAIVYAIERKRADMVGKKLLRASIGTLSGPGSGSVAMIHEHLAHVADFLHDLRAHATRPRTPTASRPSLPTTRSTWCSGRSGPSSRWMCRSRAQAPRARGSSPTRRPRQWRPCRPPRPLPQRPQGAHCFR